MCANITDTQVSKTRHHRPFPLHGFRLMVNAAPLQGSPAEISFPWVQGFPFSHFPGLRITGAGAPHATGAGPVSKVPSFYHPEC